jgi:UDP-N-acetylmuramate--alanine ligase
MVVEADESDGTFIKIPSTVAVVTNIDPEHLDFYGDFENTKAAFKTFIENVPFYGFAAMCIDHPEVQTLIGKIIDRRIVTYGFSPQAKVRGKNVSFSEGSAVFDVEITNRNDDTVTTFEKIEMPMPGRHNVLNALAAIAVSHELGIEDEVIRLTFSKFSGVKRRFTLVDKIDGITIVDDYAHHPVEIASVLSAAREAYNGKVIAIMQPHRYTRLESLFDEFCACFNDADTVIVAPVFEAGEKPIKGADQEALINGLQSFGHRDVLKINGPDDIAGVVSEIASKDDLVIFLGAGSVSQWAYYLPEALKGNKG